MKTVIIYASVHHNNTKELVCAIAAENDIAVSYTHLTLPTNSRV